LTYNSIDTDILEFVEKYVDTFAAWDLLRYFHENPASDHTVSEIALEIGRKESSIAEPLERLKEMGLVTSEIVTGEETSYKYAAPPEFCWSMERFLEATRDRTNRLAVVSIVLRKEARKI